MAQTFNRRPYLQDGPRKSDVENHTFDNYKFTGFKEDKNFLEIDQYSFEECDNVYVDNDGLLRSRPSIKKTDIFEGVTDLLRLLRQNDVYIAQYTNYYNIYYGNSYVRVDGEVYSATSYGDKVYIFGTDINKHPQIVCYDKKRPTEIQTQDLIYIPETEVQANSDSTKVEPKNALTEKTKTVYLYTTSQYSSNLFNREITYNAFGETFTFIFNDNSKKTILRIVSDVDQFKNWIWKYANSTFFVYHNINDTYGNFLRCEMAYSYDGINFIRLPDSLNKFDSIKMFKDGTGFMCKFANDNVNLRYFNFNESNFIIFKTFNNTGNSINSVDFAGENSNNFFAFCVFYTGSTDYPSKMYHKYDNNIYESDLYTYNNGSVVKATSGGRLDLYFGATNLLDLQQSPAVELQVLGYLTLTDDGNTVWVYPYHDSSLDYRYVWFNTYAPSNYGAFADIRLSANFYTVLFLRNDRSILSYMSLLHQSNDAYLPGNFAGYNGRIYSDGFNVGTNYYFYSNDTGELSWKITNESFNIISAENDVWGLKTIDGKLKLVTSYFDVNNPIKLTELIAGNDTVILPDQIEQLNEYYFRVGNKLYISEYREDEAGNLQWYLPEINIEEFDGFVTMCPLSSTEMGIFTETGVYIVYRSEQQYEMSTGWKYYPYIQIKSKMDVKIRKGSDVLSTYDGTSLIVPTTRGLALMTYQDFVQSTDQKLEFLSDTIYDAFEKYNTREIKLFKYSYWFFVYREDDKMLFLLDIRNGSWWPMSGNKSLKSFILYNDKPLLLSSNGDTYVFDKRADDYKDDDGFINWYLKSQKLYLGAPNYYKHIQNLTFMSHLLGENSKTGNYYEDIIKKGYTFKCYLRNTVYRSRASSDAEGKMWEYDIEMIRSYVLRLNYPKVCEFQYELRMNKENATINFIPVPLSLSNITVKYKMGGQIR